MTGRGQFIKDGAAGLAGTLAGRCAPSFARTTPLHLLSLVDVIPQAEGEIEEIYEA